MQTPRPGNRRLISGTTEPSGPTTKRISSPTGRTSRVAMHNRSLGAATVCASQTVTACSASLCMMLRHNDLGRLLGDRFGLLGNRELGVEFGFRDPSGLEAGLHDYPFSILPRAGQTT